MVRKRRTGLPSSGSESSESQQSNGDQGRSAAVPQPSVEQNPSHHQVGYQGGRGKGSGPQRGGYGGRGGRQRVCMPQRGPLSQGHGGHARPPVPELHQATQYPFQAGVVNHTVSSVISSETHMEVGYSSSQPEPPEKAQQLYTQPEPSEGQEVMLASSKLMKFPLRPGKGSTGTKCIVKANHFFVALPDKDLYQYDVSITPEISSRGVNRAVIRELVRLYRESHLGMCFPIYDGRKSLFTAGVNGIQDYSS